jgi:hypothetical protein
LLFRNAKNFPGIFLPLAAVFESLGRAPVSFCEQLAKRGVELGGEVFGEDFSLVVAAFPAADPVHGHTGNGVNPGSRELLPKTEHLAAEEAAEVKLAIVLETVDAFTGRPAEFHRGATGVPRAFVFEALVADIEQSAERGRAERAAVLFVVTHLIQAAAAQAAVVEAGIFQTQEASIRKDVRKSLFQSLPHSFFTPLWQGLFYG